MKKVGKRKFDIKKEYEDSWKYLKECRTFIYFITGIFFIFLLIGLFVPAPEFLYDKIMSYIRELLGRTEGMSALQIIWFIISNNITSTFLSIVFGIFLGIFPVVNSIVNGYMLGFVSNYSVSLSNGNFLILWKILPHGIFELPAVFISLGLGAKLGTFMFQKDKANSFKNYFINSLKAFLLIVIPLLIIAGIIEGTIMALA